MKNWMCLLLFYFEAKITAFYERSVSSTSQSYKYGFKLKKAFICVQSKALCTRVTFAKINSNQKTLKKTTNINYKMYKNKTIIFFMLIVLQQRSFIAAIKIKCSHVDGYFAVTPNTQCGTYYRCTSRGHFEIKGCSRGDIFDIEQQICSHETDECAEPTCDGRNNGVFPDSTHGCRRYFTCFGGKLTTLDHCPAQHLHNGLKCVPQTQFTCPTKTITNTDEQLCRGKPNGAIADPFSTDCSTYIMCHNDKFQKRKQCSKQAVFNGQQCVPAPLYQCLSSNKSDQSINDVCQPLQDGLHAHPQLGCTAYFRCLSNQLVEINHCKGDQYFEPDLGKCVYERLSSNRRCQDLGFSAECSTKPNGFHKGKSCNQYFHCHAGKQVDYTCSTGKVFNGEKCVASSLYSCHNDKDEFCQSHEDGYYKDTQDGCRAYKYCSNGNKITYLCDQDYVFDDVSNKCVPNNDGNCSSDEICKNKSDGYHADLKRNCQKYVYCQKQAKIVQLSCRDGYVFNGQQCVPNIFYACPNSYYNRKTNCLPQNCVQKCSRDGLFVDLSSNCTDYYFCIGGKASKLSCPSGRRFNGELCVPADQFDCPTICANSFKPRTDQCSIEAYNSN